MKTFWRKFIFKAMKMKALEFISKIDGNKIKIPNKFKSDLSGLKNANVRVIMLLDENNEYKDEQDFKSMAAEQFYKGYAEIDSAYDKEYGDE